MKLLKQDDIDAAAQRIWFAKIRFWPPPASHSIFRQFPREVLDAAWAQIQMHRERAEKHGCKRNHATREFA